MDAGATTTVSASRTRGRKPHPTNACGAVSPNTSVKTSGSRFGRAKPSLRGSRTRSVLPVNFVPTPKPNAPCSARSTKPSLTGGRKPPTSCPTKTKPFAFEPKPPSTRWKPLSAVGRISSAATPGKAKRRSTGARRSPWTTPARPTWRCTTSSKTYGKPCFWVSHCPKPTPSTTRGAPPCKALTSSGKPASALLFAPAFASEMMSRRWPCC